MASGFSVRSSHPRPGMGQTPGNMHKTLLSLGRTDTTVILLALPLIFSLAFC